MKTYTATDLAEIIEKHEMWLRGEDGGSHANLSYANLSYANLRNADLRAVDLRAANLRNADLSAADLSDANLRNADLRAANLRAANLSDADLSDANLRYADLSYANLRNADLSDANLRNANLRYASIWGATGEMTHLKSIFLEEYQITYTADVMQISCQRHKIEDWWKFDDERIIGMDGKRALKFWRKYKDFIKMAIELSPAKPTKEVA